MMKKVILAGIVIMFAVGGFVTLFPQPGDGASTRGVVTVYKSETCGCCASYIGHLKSQGFEVEVVNMEDASSIKRKYNIPRNMQSCHTTVVGDYFIEGHVPMEAVKKLLDEEPAIDGIALPGMPAGSPGMPGMKQGAFEIYALSGGTPSLFMTI